MADAPSLKIIKPSEVATAPERIVIRLHIVLAWVIGISAILISLYWLGSKFSAYTESGKYLVTNHAIVPMFGTILYLAGIGLACCGIFMGLAMAALALSNMIVIILVETYRFLRKCRLRL